MELLFAVMCEMSGCFLWRPQTHTGWNLKWTDIWTWNKINHENKKTEISSWKLFCYQVNQHRYTFNVRFNTSCTTLPLIWLLLVDWLLMALLLVLVYFTVSFPGYPNFYADGLYKWVSYNWLQIFPPTACTFLFNVRFWEHGLPEQQMLILEM